MVIDTVILQTPTAIGKSEEGLHLPELRANRRLSDDSSWISVQFELNTPSSRKNL
jgi:hypothetical protein